MAEQTTPTPNPHGGRTANGRFAPGNKGGPGNPFARRVAALRTRALQSATDEDMDKVMAVLKEKALAGDVSAIKLWLSYCAGKPGDTPDPDTLDRHDLKVRRENTAVPADMRNLAQAVPASLMCEIAEAMQPHLDRHLAEEFVEGVRDYLAAEKPPADGSVVRDPVHAWREAGLSADAAFIFEECPAWLPVGQKPCATPPPYSRVVKRMGEDLFARLAERPEAGGGGPRATRAVTQREDDGPAQGGRR